MVSRCILCVRPITIHFCHGSVWSSQNYSTRSPNRRGPLHCSTLVPPCAVRFSPQNLHFHCLSRTFPGREGNFDLLQLNPITKAGLTRTTTLQLITPLRQHDHLREQGGLHQARSGAYRTVRHALRSRLLHLQVRNRSHRHSARTHSQPSLRLRNK
jgi:hypothetical protein